MNNRLVPGLTFRIRDTPISRRAGLSPHISKGWITHIDEHSISFTIEPGGATSRPLSAKVDMVQFQDLFSIIPWEAPRSELIQSKPNSRLFITE